MTADEILANITSHNACAEGVAWAAGKDGKTFWSTSDDFAAPYLFWFAAKNADQAGFASTLQIMNVLKSLAILAGKYNADSHYFETKLLYSTETPLEFFTMITRRIGFENRLAYYAEILPIVRTLESTI